MFSMHANHLCQQMGKILNPRIFLQFENNEYGDTLLQFTFVGLFIRSFCFVFTFSLLAWYKRILIIFFFVIVLPCSNSDRHP